jgi:hypothetical protein
MACPSCPFLPPGFSPAPLYLTAVLGTGGAAAAGSQEHLGNIKKKAFIYFCGEYSITELDFADLFPFNVVYLHCGHNC